MMMVSSREGHEGQRQVVVKKIHGLGLGWRLLIALIGEDQLAPQLLLLLLLLLAPDDGSAMGIVICLRRRMRIFHVCNRSPTRLFRSLQRLSLWG